MPFITAYLTQPLPAPSYPVDVTGGIPDDGYGMLGNGPDPTCTTYPAGVGDCTFAARQHLKMTKAAAYRETETWETSNELVAEYLAYDNGQDEGAILSDLLMAWFKTGKVLAFAPLDHTSPAAVDAGMLAFHGAYCGVNLTDDAEQLFGEGQPWTVANGEQPDPSEGHCIVKVKADGHSTDGWVSWGALQDSTTAWTTACLEEAWVIITQEDADAHGVDLAALRADIEALHGTGGAPPAPQPKPPAPAPQPQPTPPAPVIPPPPDPAPTLLEELAAAVRSCAASVQKDVTELLAFLASHGL